MKRAKSYRMIQVVLSAAAIVLILGFKLAYAIDIGSGVDFNGYFRSGAAQNSKGGAMSQGSFWLQGADTHYRLGNESDTYGDFLFSKTAWQSADGSKFKLYFQPTIYGTDLTENTTYLNGTNFYVGQLYAEGLDIPELYGAKIWVGRRLYKRDGIHILDMFYHNPSGTGAGIEDFPLFKGASLSYGFFRNNVAGAPPYYVSKEGASRHDLQLRDIPLYEGGSLNIGGQFINNDGRNATGQNHDGYNFIVQYSHSFKDLGTNTLWATYGVGPGTGLGNVSSLANNSDITATRLFDFFTFQATRNFGGQLVAGFTHNKNPAGDSDWYTVGGRLSYALTDHFKLLGEVGHDQVSPQGEASRSLTKLTFAPTISLGRDFWARPELRFYYTYATWNKAAQAAAAPGSSLSSTGAFDSDTHGANYGVQVEAWW